MTQMLFCCFKNIFSSNKSQLPDLITPDLPSYNPLPSKNQGSRNKTKQTKTPKKCEEKEENPNNFQ